MEADNQVTEAETLIASDVKDQTEGSRTRLGVDDNALQVEVKLKLEVEDT